MNRRDYIAAIDATSGTATTWIADADNVVNTLVVSGTTIYAGGEFANIGGKSRNFIAALDATLDTATTLRTGILTLMIVFTPWL